MAEQCGMVSPFWVHLGWVQWQGAPQREKLFAIDYRRCPSTETAPTSVRGVHTHLCAEHGVDPSGGADR